VGVGAGVAVGGGVGVALAVGAGVGVALAVGVGVGVGVGVSVLDGVGVGVAVAESGAVGAGVGVGVGAEAGVGVAVPVAVGAGDGAPDGFGVADAGSAPTCCVGEGWAPGPRLGWGVVAGIVPGPFVPLALAPKLSQLSGAGSQFRPAPTKGSHVKREPVGQIRVPGPRPSTKKRSRNARSRASNADVTRSRRVLQNPFPGVSLRRMVSVATSISLRNDGHPNPYLRR